MIIFQILSVLIPSILIVGTSLFIKNEKVLKIIRIVSGSLMMLSVILLLISPHTSTYRHNRFEIYYTYSIFSGRFESVFDKRIDALSMALLIWLNFISTGVMFTSIFYNTRVLRRINIFVYPITLVLNIISYPKLIKAMVGDIETYLLFHQIILLLIIIFGSAFFISNLIREIRFLYKDDVKFKDLSKKEKVRTIFDYVLLSLVLIIFFMPSSTLRNFFGLYGEKVRDFNKLHIMMLLIYATLMIVSCIYLRKRDEETKFALLGILCMSLFQQYFYTYFHYMNDLAAYPIHICNTAAILLPVAVFAKSKGIFFFTYFMNVLGALFAAIYPDTEDLFEPTVIEFWSNHGMDIIIPLMGVILGAFKKPSLTDMLKAVGIFSIYFALAQVMGLIVNKNCEPLVTDGWNADYFFLYGEKLQDINFLERFVYRIRSQYIFTFERNGNKYYIYYVFSILMYLGFIGFSFVVWFVYDQIYLISDDIKVLRYKTKLKNEKIGKTSKEEVKRIKELMGGKTMINISHFSKRYGSAANFSVKDFSLKIEDGDVFGFIGHNGAGKSTVIKSLVGIQSITEGNIEVCGYDIEKYPLQAKLNIGYVSDNHAVYEKLTGREYIEYVARLYQVPKDVRDERLEYYAKMFGLTDALDREAKSYSHGMKQKLVVISSLIHDPKVWVLDEPLTGLDPTSSYQIKECMKEHASKGNIVFFSTHVIEVIEKLCTKIAIIAHGKLMGVYKIEDLKKEGISLESLYLKYVVSDSNRGEFSEEDIKTTDAGLFIEKMKKEEETQEETKE